MFGCICARSHPFLSNSKEIIPEILPIFSWFSCFLVLVKFMVITKTSQSRGLTQKMCFLFVVHSAAGLPLPRLGVCLAWLGPRPFFLLLASTRRRQALSGQGCPWAGQIQCNHRDALCWLLVLSNTILRVTVPLCPLKVICLYG